MNTYPYIYISIYLYEYVYGDDLNSFICKPPFFVNKQLLSRFFSGTPRLSFAEVSSCGGLILESFAKSFAKENLSRTQKKLCGVSCWNPGGLCNGPSLHGPLDRRSYYIILSIILIYIHIRLYI